MPGEIKTSCTTPARKPATPAHEPDSFRLVLVPLARLMHATTI